MSDNQHNNDPQLSNSENDFFGGSPSFQSGLDSFYNQTLLGAEQPEADGAYSPVATPTPPSPAQPQAQAQTQQPTQVQPQTVEQYQRVSQIQRARTQFEYVEADGAGEEIETVSVRKSIIEWVVVGVGAVLLALFIRTFLLQAFWIPSPSMRETLIEGDRILVNKVNYRFTDIDRFDVVVFSNPDVASESKELVKRVIGLPGETVELVDGEVFIDGTSIGPESYIYDEAINDDNFGPMTVPERSYFVLGDNRSNSSDSRAPSVGMISEDLVQGKAFIKFWPFSRIGRVQ